MLPGLPFFPHSPQVEVVLQQLVRRPAAPLVQELFQLAGREHRRGRARELGGQRGEQGRGRRERIISGTAEYAAMRVLLP